MIRILLVVSLGILIPIVKGESDSEGKTIEDHTENVLTTTTANYNNNNNHYNNPSTLWRYPFRQYQQYQSNNPYYNSYPSPNTFHQEYPSSGYGGMFSRSNGLFNPPRMYPYVYPQPQIWSQPQWMSDWQWRQQPPPQVSLNQWNNPMDSYVETSDEPTRFETISDSKEDDERRSNDGFVMGSPKWIKSYTPMHQNGCFNRCRPTCGNYGFGYGCRPSCRSACNIRPTCGSRYSTQYNGNTMICGRGVRMGGQYNNMDPGYWNGQYPEMMGSHSNTIYSAKTLKDEKIEEEKAENEAEEE